MFNKSEFKLIYTQMIQWDKQENSKSLPSYERRLITSEAKIKRARGVNITKNKIYLNSQAVLAKDISV